MKTISISNTMNNSKQWLKTSSHPMAKLLFVNIKRIINVELNAPKFVLAPLYALFCLIRNSIANISRIFFWTPLFKGRLNTFGARLYLYGGLPYISGPVAINLGQDCRISGQTTITGRTCAPTQPALTVGNNVDIGWMTTIAVGSSVQLGDNVRIAGRALLAGYPGHPLNAELRAQGLPETDAQVGAIIIEQDVWLATGVSVMAGVTIGAGTIVAAGSVVTHNLPASVLAGGIPAKVIRQLTPAELNAHNIATPTANTTTVNIEKENTHA